MYLESGLCLEDKACGVRLGVHRIARKSISGFRRLQRHGSGSGFISSSSTLRKLSILISVLKTADDLVKIL